MCVCDVFVSVCVLLFVHLLGCVFVCVCVGVTVRVLAFVSYVYCRVCSRRLVVCCFVTLWCQLVLVFGVL